MSEGHPSNVVTAQSDGSRRMGRLLERVEPRLRERAEQAALQLVVEADDMIRSATIHSDPAAIEQILFNLVDNACKYAADTADRRLHLQVVPRSATEIACLVIDHGPGITAQQAQRLFRPVSKSVHEAASTAPGVGLGLALCRRRARAIGGRLELAPTNNADIAAQTGAKFSLWVKRTSGERGHHRYTM